MPASNSHRRRPPSSPSLSHLHLQNLFTADPASPPETPITSPEFSRRSSLKPRHQPPFDHFVSSLASDPTLKPVGHGHQFSYQPTLGPDQLSPRSSSSSSVGFDNPEKEDGTENKPVSAKYNSDDGNDGGQDLPQGPTAANLRSSTSYWSRYQPFLEQQALSSDTEGAADSEGDDADDDEGGSGSDCKHDGAAGAEGILDDDNSSSPEIVAAAIWDFIIEEIDPMDASLGSLDILYPYEIEPARSRSNSWNKERTYKDLDRSMMRDLKNLNCSNEASDNESLDEEPEFDLEEEIFLKRQQELRRIRRVSMSSSVGKRTHSELSDSDDDFKPLDVNDVGSSARRLRKRLHRSSLLFHDPPEQIEELDEPDSGEDEYQPGRSLAQELPYWTMEIMEIGSC